MGPVSMDIQFSLAVLSCQAGIRKHMVEYGGICVVHIQEGKEIEGSSQWSKLDKEVNSGGGCVLDEIKD